MNHTFIAAKWNPKVCNKCTKSEDVHGNEVVCESCSNVGPIEVVGKLLLCKSCENRELNTVITPISEQERISLEQIRNQVDRLVDGHVIVNSDNESIKDIIDKAIRGNIKQYTDFFNAKIPSIIELKELIELDEEIVGEENKRYALAHALRARIQYLARVLFQVRSGEIEMGAEIKSIQEYMSKLIPDLRMKLRAEFAQATPNYTPQVIKQTKVRTKSGTSDKLAESYAKMMKISIEEAKRLIEKRLRPDCSCSETPGMCKVHNK